MRREPIIIKVLDDGSYLSWINPDRKSKKKGLTKIQVRVIEYIIETDGELKTYRLVTFENSRNSRIGLDSVFRISVLAFDAFIRRAIALLMTTTMKVILEELNRSKRAIAPWSWNDLITYPTII